MGVENNECVIAVTWNDKAVKEVKKWVEKFIPTAFQQLFTILPGVVNGKQTIVFAPDGSKKGWQTSAEGERLRNKLIEKLESFNYDDGSNPFDFVEVGFGEFGQKVLRGNCVNCYGDAEYAED